MSDFVETSNFIINKRKPINTETDVYGFIYDRNEVIDEVGDIDFRKSTHRSVKYSIDIGNIYKLQVRLTHYSGSDWIEFFDIYVSEFDALYSYEEFKKSYKYMNDSLKDRYYDE